MSDVLVIPERFRGPARSGNGGWTAGSLAELAFPAAARPAEPATVQVTLRQPPPLETTLTVGRDDGLTTLSDGDELVAEAREVDLDLTPVDEVDREAAAAAMAAYPGHRSHPFPGCFACGPDRAEGDGLRIFPGPVGPDRVASLWTPAASLAASGVELVGVATTWAALDCVGGWSEDLAGRPCVLGRMTARVDALPVVGEPHVVVGQRLGADGRKTFTASTLYDPDHRVVATAEHVWIVVDPSIFN